MTAQNTTPSGTETPGVLTPGALREQIWSALLHQRQATYPLPPHGHNPNFKGARAAAKHLLTHPSVAAANVVLVGMEAALKPMREVLLSAGKTIVVPHRLKHQQGVFWRISTTNKAAAKLENMMLYGQTTTLKETTPEIAILASVLVDETGLRLSKGFGFGQHGAPVDAPTFTLAHTLMVRDHLGVPHDSRVEAFATPKTLVRCDTTRR